MSEKTNEQPLAEWQRICFGDDDAARAAFAYYRECGWPVDMDSYPQRWDCEDQLYAFIAGYRAALAAPPAPQPAIDGMRAAIQQWAIYCFNRHGDDANLYNGLAELGGVDFDGKGWVPAAAAPAPVALDLCRDGNPHYCPNCDRTFAPPAPVEPPAALAPPATPKGDER